MERAMARRFPGLGSASALALLALTGIGSGVPARAETLTVGIGTQDTTTNTATVGVVIRQLKLLEKYLPKTADTPTRPSCSIGRTSPPVRR